MSNLIVIAPHPDDDILCCSDAIFKNKHNVKVIFVTDGSKGSPLRAEWGPSLASKRMNEAYNALKKLGVDRDQIVFLNNEDGEVRKNFAKIYGQLSKILTSEDITRIYFPSPFDVHPDHAYTGRVILSIVKDYRLKHVELFMYTIHNLKLRNIFPPTRYYLNNLLWAFKIKVSWKYICTKVENLTLKREALKEHQSQFNYMGEDVKRIWLSEYECFYFKHI